MKYVGEFLSKLVLLRTGFLTLRLVLRSAYDLSRGVESTKSAVRLIEDSTRLFNQRFDIADEFLLIEFIILAISIGLIKLLHS